MSNTWDGFRGGPHRTANVQDADEMTNPELDWSIGVRDAEILPHGLRATDNCLFIGRTDGLSAIDMETGNQIWNYTNGSPIYGVELGDKNIYLGTENGVVALNQGSGSIKNTYDVTFEYSSELENNIIVDGSTIYVNTKGNLHALHAPTMTVLWQQNGSICDMALRDELLYTIQSGRLIAIDKESGTIRAEEGPGPERTFVSINGAFPFGVVTILEDQDAIYESHKNYVLHDPHLTEDLVYKVGSWSNSITSENHIFFISTDGISGFRFTTREVEQDWETTGSLDFEKIDIQYSENSGRSVPIVPAMIVGDFLYLGSDKGVVARSIADGNITFNYTSIAPVRAMAFTDRLYVASDTHVHALSQSGTKIYSE